MENIVKNFDEFVNEAKQSSFKTGWIGTFVKNSKGKKFEVIDAKNYGSYQELFLKHGIVLQIGASRKSAGILDATTGEEYKTV